MKKISKNHVLLPESQKNNDKEAIRHIIELYNIEDSTNLLYNIINKVIDDKEYIDICVDICIAEFDDEKEND